MDLLTTMMGLQERHGAVTDEMLRELSKARGTPLYHLEGLRGFYPIFRTTPGPATQVRVCRDIACAMKEGEARCEQVKKALDGREDVEVQAVSCLGRCDSAPAVTVNDIPVSGDAEALAAYARGETPLPSGEPAGTPHAWPTDPYGDTQAHYGVLRKVLAAGISGLDAEAKRDEVIAVLKASGLHGMGGAGFPTGLKWELTRKTAGRPKYVICNADESEPGTFKDRLILEQLPHLVIEAMVIAGWMIGAEQGIIYLRHEYGPEQKALQRALERARAAGVLGDAVLGAGFGFDLRIFVSPGGYVLGEETALLEALEDRRGEPRNKPPFPTDHGLWGKPTLMNNVETFAAVPIILDKGADWWAGQGKEPFKGLKYVSVSGDVAQPGVHCVPMGTSVGELLMLCGGITDGKAPYAFAPGGASSSFLPASRLDVPLDFHALQQAGSMLGSGAVIFVAEGRDLMALALNETRFFRNESCGKCVPCRLGSQKAVDLLEAALDGQPQEGLMDLLRELGGTMARTSLCGLGQVALQPVLSVMEHFPEYAAERLHQRTGGGR